MQNRVLLIGPVLPYRGGIAQHTTMLHRALRDQIPCLTLSFSRQYPRWLFPGKTDRDIAYGNHREPGVEYVIDSLNPLTWHAAIKRAKEFAPTSVIFPWWHVYWAPCFFYIATALKKQGIRIVFLCHNSVEHENARWKSIMTARVFSRADLFVVHTKSDYMNLSAQFPCVPMVIHPLPAFDHFPIPVYSLPRRNKLELLFFGFVRPYKGLEVLLDALALLESEQVHLSVVGEFWDGESNVQARIKELKLETCVEVVGEYVSDMQAAAYFERCDVVVLPYHNATGSAVIPLAYHYNKPVIATNVGGLPDAVIDGVTGTLIPSDSPAALAKAISEVLAGSVNYDLTAIRELKTRFTWKSLADTVAQETGQA